ncbi:HEPN domain-containing protein [Streptosporangium sp. NPDC002524]|uniref:ApeA N-terminal domain 1-containing protein n=1 Tax=Streptosporangium sp. NPDC002524 TaxID=3154537 RepID=UPI0033181C09
MRSSLAEELEGGLGHFWPFHASKPNFRKQPERGYIHRDKGWLMIETLDERPWAARLDEEKEGNPRGIAAMLSERSILLLEAQWAGSTQRSGYRVSSRRYRARTAIGRIPVDELQSSKLLGITANFHGIGTWAGLTATEESHESNKDGRLESWTVTLKSPPSTNHGTSRGRILSLSTTWKVGGAEDRRQLSAPVSITCKSVRPRDLWDLLQPVLHIQNMLNLAWEGFVTASSGSAELHLKTNATSKEDHPELWNGALMVPLAGVSSPKAINERPLFTLETVGGIAGLARWIKLCDTYPRAVGPVVNLYRFGPATSEASLLAVAAGIEYWVKCNRPALWANKHFTKALAGHVGKPFSQWVGDPDAWADDFWKTYNKLKHEITYVVDPRKLSDLVRSGRLLLGADLLNRVARTKEPSRWLFHSHRTYNLGERLRDRYT